jgi:uncharacterized membrane protein YjgN (DUF898 family)
MSDPSPPSPPGASELPPGLPAVPAQVPFEHRGRVRELLAISLLNLLLKLLTLGVYHFWAKTRVRRYVWSHTAFFGEAFEYSGRGLELLLGYVIAMAVLVPLVAALNVLPLLAAQLPWLSILGSVAVYPVLAFLTGFATFSARRYLLSRTRWRSIRFGLTGRARDHGLQTLLYGLLAMVTGGLYVPFMRNRLTAHLVGNAWFGSERFRYEGPDDVLLRRYLLAGALMLGGVLAWALLIGVSVPFAARYVRGVEPAALLRLLPVLVGVVAGLLVLPSLWIAWLWYKAGELRHFVAYTRLSEVRFTLELSTGRYVWLYVSNLAALLFTLGLAYPWVVIRTARTLGTSLRMHGSLDLAAIQQHAASAPRTGEGLADALDLGSI